MADYRTLDDATPAEWNEAQAAWRKRMARPEPLPSDDPTVAAALDAARLARRTVLDEAADITSGDRNEQYGTPEENLGAISEAWELYLRRRYGVNVVLDARAVAMMMVLTKVVRDAHTPKRDNLVDICGYARTAEMLDE